MTEITLNLEAGFDHDDVLIKWSGEERRYKDVTTDYSLGLALSENLPASDQASTLVVTLIKKNITESMLITPDIKAVLINISPDNNMEIRASRESKCYF